MKILKSLLIIISAIMLVSLSMIPTFAKTNTATMDEAVISKQEDKFVPLYTTSADSSLKNHSQQNFSSKDYQLFYTQTTFLALIAGYLILFKFKGLKNSEKMHRRRIKK